VFNFAAAVSLVLCMATVGLWVRSYRRADSVALIRGGSNGTHHVLGSARGAVYYWNSHWSPDGSGVRLTRESRALDSGLRDELLDSGRDVFGFGLVSHAGSPPGSRFLLVRVPYWAIAWILAFCAFRKSTYAFGRRVRAYRRSMRGYCANCGYDLRASRERCPECGEPIPTTRRGDITSAHESK
jgi:hypothetical protein